MTKQTTVRLPDDLANEAGTVARVHGTSVNQLIIDSLATEIDRVRSDADFMSRARWLLERDQAIIDRLAE
jgi:predicted transcriptional regulator